MEARNRLGKGSVADPGCLSRIPDPGSWFFTHPGSRIQKQQQKRELKKKFLSYLFLPQISQNCKLFYFWSAEEKNLGQFSKKYRTFNQKALKNMVLGSGIRDPGSRIQGSKRHRIPDPDPQHWEKGCHTGSSEGYIGWQNRFLGIDSWAP